MSGSSLPQSRLNLPLLLSLLGAGILLQVAVPLLRVATSYQAVSINLPLEQIGTLSAAFALLPVLFAVQIGRYNDRRGEGGMTVLGALLVAVAVLGLWLWPPQFIPMMVFTCCLGIGQVMMISTLQMITTRCSGPDQYDRILGMFLVATAAGQVIGPLLISLSTPAGDLYPDGRLYLMVALATAALLICAALLKLGLPPHVPKGNAKPVAIAEILRTRGLVAILLASSLCLATNDLITVFFPVLGATRGIDAATVGLLLSLRAAASMLSRLGFSWLVLRLGKTTIMVVALLATALATGILIFDLPMWALTATLAVSGFTIGLCVACSLSLTLALAPIDGKATAMSLRLLVSRFAQFALPLSAGFAASALGPGSIFAFMGICLFGCGTMIRRKPQGVASEPASD